MDEENNIADGRNDFAAWKNNIIDERIHFVNEQNNISGGENDFADWQNNIPEGRIDFVDPQNDFFLGKRNLIHCKRGQSEPWTKEVSPSTSRAYRK